MQLFFYLFSDCFACRASIYRVVFEQFNKWANASSSARKLETGQHTVLVQRCIVSFIVQTGPMAAPSSGTGGYPSYASQPSTVGYQQVPAQQPAQQYQQTGYGEFVDVAALTMQRTVIDFTSSRLIYCWIPTCSRTELCCRQHWLCAAGPTMGNHILTCDNTWTPKYTLV